ncbi:MAG: hypothetical protein ACQSGP_14925 [Frankia sp.]
MVKPIAPSEPVVRSAGASTGPAAVGPPPVDPSPVGPIPVDPSPVGLAAPGPTVTGPASDDPGPGPAEAGSVAPSSLAAAGADVDTAGPVVLDTGASDPVASEPGVLPLVGTSPGPTAIPAVDPDPDPDSDPATIEEPAGQGAVVSLPLSLPPLLPPASRPGPRQWLTKLCAVLDDVDATALPPVGRTVLRARDAVAECRRTVLAGATRTSRRFRRMTSSDGRWEKGARLALTAAVGVVAVGALASFGHGWVADRQPTQPDPSPAVADGGATILPASIPSGAPIPGLPAAAAGPIAFVGRSSGESVPGYVAAAGRRLAALAWADGDTSSYAVVSLPGYRTPAQLTGLLAGYRVVEVFFRVPPYGTAMAIAVDDPAVDVPAAFNRAAVLGDRRAVARGSSATIAARAADQARALRARCSCVYGAVVRAPAARLASLSASAGIRLVDPAPAAQVILRRTRFAALLPEQQ